VDIWVFFQNQGADPS